MVSRTLTVENPHGLHMRVAGEIVRITRESGARVRISRDKSPSVSGDSLMDLLLLEAGLGCTVSIKVDGPKAESIADQISQLFNDGDGI